MLKAILMLLAVAVAVHGRRFHRELPSNMEEIIRSKMNEIEECRPLYGDGGSTDVPSCTAQANTCLSGVHTKALECLFKEFTHWMKKPGAKECREQNGEKGKAWMRQMCVMQTAVSDCVAGEDAGVDDTFAGLQSSLADYHHMKKHFKQDCWKDVKASMTECDAQAVSGCPNFNVCIGKGSEPDDERLKTWWKVSRYNKDTMVQKMKIAITAFEACLDSKIEAAWFR